MARIILGNTADMYGVATDADKAFDPQFDLQEAA